MALYPPQANSTIAIPDRDKDLAAVSYFLIFAFVVYFLRRDSVFGRYHSKQAIILCIFAVVLWFLPSIGKPLELLILAGILYGFNGAAQGLWRDVPVIGALAVGELGRAMHELIRLPHRCITFFTQRRYRSSDLARLADESMLSETSTRTPPPTP